MKARFIKALKNTNSFDKHSWEHTDLLYEYRGYEYIITKHNNGYAFDSLSQQHKEAQKEIDERIERKNNPIPEQKYEGSGQEGFDLAWEYFEKGE